MIQINNDNDFITMPAKGLKAFNILDWEFVFNELVVKLHHHVTHTWGNRFKLWLSDVPRGLWHRIFSITVSPYEDNGFMNNFMIFRQKVTVSDSPSRNYIEHSREMGMFSPFQLSFVVKEFDNSYMSPLATSTKIVEGSVSWMVDNNIGVEKLTEINISVEPYGEAKPIKDVIEYVLNKNVDDKRWYMTNDNRMVSKAGEDSVCIYTIYKNDDIVQMRRDSSLWNHMSQGMNSLPEILQHPRSHFSRGVREYLNPMNEPMSVMDALGHMKKHKNMKKRRFEKAKLMLKKGGGKNKRQIKYSRKKKITKRQNKTYGKRRAR